MVKGSFVSQVFPLEKSEGYEVFQAKLKLSRDRIPSWGDRSSDQDMIVEVTDRRTIQGSRSTKSC